VELATRDLGQIVSNLSVDIPKTPEAADTKVGALTTLTNSGDWAVAAIVSARTTRGKPGPQKDDGNIPVNYKQYAALKIHGLKDWETVKFYAWAWETYAGLPKPSLGDTVDLPTAPFPRRTGTTLEALTSSDSNEWYTPEQYLVSIRLVLGKIDLDPASCETANQTVRAKKFYTKEDSGLQYDWPGYVFMNPPWGREGPAFADRLTQQFNDRITTAAIMLVNAHATETTWFAPYFDHILCFTDHRIDYDSPEEKTTTSTHGSVFAYLGDDWPGFAEEFGKWGNIVARYK
jgi:phage N-6-adenine-methyltransferase